jgi:perosamine synthetase
MTDSVQLQAPRAQRIALEGGEPVRRQLLPYGAHSVTDEDINAVVEVLRSAWLTTGPKVGAFEEAFAAAVGARHAVAVSSGTAALHAAVFAAGLAPGDEGVTTPLTFCATANCLLYQGARAVFADVEEETLTLDPKRVAEKLTPRTKAILPVDYAGHPAALDAFLELANARGLVVIEDATHAPGAWYRGRRIGSISHMSVFSFHPVKHLTTGEGGMVTTNDDRLARRLRLFRNHGIDQHPPQDANQLWYYEMQELGYNYRQSDLGCALGLSQLQRLEVNLARRQALAARYTEAFRWLPEVRVPICRPEVRHAWHLYPVRLELERLRVDRAQMIRALRAEGLGVTVHFIPVHLHPYYQRLFGCREGQYPIAEAAYHRLISLPIFAGMSDEDATDVIEGVTKVISAYLR